MADVTMQPLRIWVLYAGEDGTPHPHAASPSYRGDYLVTKTQAGKLLMGIKQRLEEVADIGVITAKRSTRYDFVLRLRTRAVCDAAFAWDFLRCRILYEMLNKRGEMITSGYCQGTAIGPAGPRHRIPGDAKADFVMQLCGRNIADRVVRYLAVAGGAGRTRFDSIVELPLWVPLAWDRTTKVASKAAEPHYLAPSGTCYTLDGRRMPKVTEIDGTAFVMGDRERPRQSRSRPNR